MRKLSTLILILILAAGVAVAESGSLADPMRIGVGARSMGMGKAYVGLAEDGDALFLNPAGIARNANLKISSMYTKLLDDVDYAVLGGIYPLSNSSALGIGYIRSQTGDIILRSSAGTQEGTAGYGSNVISVSYGTYLDQLMPALGRQLVVGGSLKYYSTGASGDYRSSDSGLDLDLGVLLPLTNYMNLGLNAQNVLSTTMSQSGDDIPYNYKLGTKITLIGKEDQALLAHKDRKLNLVIDADFDKTGTYGHAGVELWPTKNLALRVGSDAGDLTAGVGIRFMGIEFDYAYHPYTNISANTTHYFSLGYLGEVLPRTLQVNLESPSDKAIIYEDHARISGRVEVSGGEEEEEIGPITLKINNVEVKVDEKLSFDVEIPVEDYGKNLVIVEASEKTGAKDSSEVRLLRLTSFADVPEGYWAKKPISDTSTVGLIKGYPDGTFKPEASLTRAELATLLIRAKGIEPRAAVSGKVFKDVPAGFWASTYIEEGKRLGLIKGYEVKRVYKEKVKRGRLVKSVTKVKKELVFRPNNKIKMTEAITILARFDKLPVAESVSVAPFADVPTNHWAAKYVEAAKSAGMLSYLTRGTLGVNNPISRAEMVEMLSKTSVASTQIKDLYTWEKGFKREIFYRPKIKAGSELAAIQEGGQK